MNIAELNLIKQSYKRDFEKIKHDLLLLVKREYYDARELNAACDSIVNFYEELMKI